MKHNQTQIKPWWAKLEQLKFCFESPKFIAMLCTPKALGLGSDRNPCLGRNRYIEAAILFFGQAAVPVPWSPSSPFGSQSHHLGAHPTAKLGQYGESRMDRTSKKTSGASKLIQLCSLFTKNYAKKVAGSNKSSRGVQRSSCYLNVVSRWDTNETQTNWITVCRLSKQPASIS